MSPTTKVMPEIAEEAARQEAAAAAEHAAEAEEAASRAAMVARAGWPKRAEGWKALKDFDTWLRVPGTKRNPGTTADLVGATLYIALVEGLLELPCRFPWWNHESPWP